MTTTRLQVIIVGAGVAGLVAAISLRREGHNVKLLERSASVSAYGAAVVINYNAAKVLTELGVDYTAARMTPAEQSKLIKGDTLEDIAVFNDIDLTKRYGTRQYYVYRIDLAEHLTQLATEQGGFGTPVEFVYGAEVVEYSADSGTVRLANGETYRGDLVIAADGVRSLAPGYVLDHPSLAHSTGTTIVRFMLPVSAVKSNELTAPLADHDGRFSFYVGPDRRRYLLSYPCREGELLNFGMYSLTDDYDAKQQEFRFQCDRDSLERELEGFHERIVGIASLANEILPVWKCPEGRPLKTWFKGRLVMIGDAAHAMLPNQGQGAGMAIEDGGALGIFFRSMSSSSLSAITERLTAFEKLRRPRASVVQLISSIPFYEDGVELMRSQLEELMPREELPASKDMLRPWLFSYNIMAEAENVVMRLMGSELEQVKGKI